ncbi:MAG: hypothetical protein GF329_11760 [Candidatus Lokiarchaeota archaeon]|nr:hypothetical protein [Candidatus Lokiarchaeota archaeon]
MGSIPSNNRVEQFIVCFYIFLMVYGLIFGILHFVPSPSPGYTSFISYLFIMGVAPLINDLFNWLVQFFGYSHVMGNENTLAARIGLSNINLNLLTWVFGIIICFLSIVAIIGIVNFRNKKKEGWIIITYLSIHLIPLLIGIIFLNYLFKKETQNTFNF